MLDTEYEGSVIFRIIGIGIVFTDRDVVTS